MRNEHARDDAAEMWGILRSAKCIKRYDRISHELLSELLVAIATDGEVVGGNNRGSDVQAPVYGKIEVKSRILGTDGPFPRISLRKSNFEKADWFTAVRWTKEFEFHDAVALPRASVIALAGGVVPESLTHFSWKSWCAAPDSVNFSAKIRAVIGDVLAR